MEQGQNGIIAGFKHNRVGGWCVVFLVRPLIVDPKPGRFDSAAKGVLELYLSVLFMDQLLLAEKALSASFG